jgi:peptidoglycan/xylan/chitin deacetylase (PgdA/CDA1 family)
MREMGLHGAEFANHSQSHDYLLPRKDESKKEWQKRLKDEIVGSQKILQNELGKNTNKNPKIFSYPYGEYSLETAEYIKSLGYISVTQTSGVINSDSDLKALPRYPMSERFGNIDDFILKANTLPLPVTNASTFDPILKAHNPPKLVLKLKHPLKNINCFISSGERIKTTWLSAVEVEIQANSPLKAPRDRYTCTARNKDRKWMWYSHLWIINNDTK